MSCATRWRSNSCVVVPLSKRLPTCSVDEPFQPYVQRAFRFEEPVVEKELLDTILPGGFGGDALQTKGELRGEGTDAEDQAGPGPVP